MGFSDLGKKLSKLGQDTKNGVQKVSDSVSISNRISAEKKSLGRLFAMIGETIYKESPDVPKEGLEDEWAAVKVAYANIASLSEQLNHVKGIIYCPNCGRPAADGDKFCAKCGFRLEPAGESTGEKMAQDLKEAGQEVGRIAGNAAGRTGEAVGGAAAQTRNAFAKLKDSCSRLLRETGEKLKKLPKQDDGDQDGRTSEEETFSVEVEEGLRAVEESEVAETAEEAVGTAEETAEAAAEETAAEETAEAGTDDLAEEMIRDDVTDGTAEEAAEETAEGTAETDTAQEDEAEDLVRETAEDTEETAAEEEDDEDAETFAKGPLFETPLTPEEMAAEAAEPAQGAQAADPEFPLG